MEIPVLTDGVVRLTGYTLADVGPHLAGEDEEQARRFGWYPQRSTRAPVHAAIRRWRREWREQGTCRGFAVRDATTGELAGGCELRISADTAEASYWIFPAYRGRGWATRALGLAIRWAADHIGIRHFIVEIEPDNLASIGVAMRVGFTPAGDRFDDRGRRMALFRRGDTVSRQQSTRSS